MSGEALSAALGQAGLGPRDVDHLFFVTVTGVATPGIDARLVNRLGLRLDVKRTPIFGLGCVAGAAGIARAATTCAPFRSRHTAALLSVELCSLTHQREDLSIANIIASGLFGDGAAAVVLTGAARSALGPQVIGSASVFYPDTERLMGWDVVAGGLRDHPLRGGARARPAEAPGDVDGFLAAHGLARGDIRHWIAHTGGPKVLEALEESLALPPEALRRSHGALAATGNLSSASVLFVLGELLDAGEAAPGDLWSLLAMGPGFCSELVLLRW